MSAAELRRAQRGAGTAGGVDPPGTGGDGSGGEGSGEQVIALDLGVSQRTVEIHRARVMQKMHARSLAELVTLAGKLSP